MTLQTPIPMNTTHPASPLGKSSGSSAREFLGSLLLTALLPLTVYGQLKSNTPDAATLAKYDVNRNGRLDPSEEAAWEADEAKAGRIPVNPTSSSSTPAST